LSGKELQLLHDEAETHGHTDASENLLRNSGHNTTDDNVDGGSEDESLDDDLIDKISSSPSIGDDGGYPLPLPWPSRITSLRSISPAEKKTTRSSDPPSDDFSSPFSETPAHFPLSFPRDAQEQSPSKDHHQSGEYAKGSRTNLVVDEYDLEKCDHLSPLVSEQQLGNFEEDFVNMHDSYEADFDPDDFHHLLLPADDPLLDNSFDGASPASESSQSSSPASQTSWNGETTGEPDDDTEDISYVADERFVDSGWGGECLRETEDIDFEFVYALHTFVATVEGQANATKGDTMVLLDDVNSYWWLVRVVKDSSIGECAMPMM